MKKIKLETTVTLYENYSSFSETEKLLFTKAKAACHSAYAPYSKFYVGAAVLLENGVILQGNNQENAAYPSGLCAERVALFYASATYPNIAVQAIAVTVFYNGKDLEDIVSPCGACRQVMAEYEHKSGKPITLYLLSANQQVCRIDSVKDTLPFLFTADILKASEGN